MKTERHILTTLVATAIFSICLIARADEIADRAELQMIRTNYMEAVNSGNLSKMAPFVSPDTTGVMVTGVEVKGMDGLKTYWDKIQNLIGPGGNYHVTVNSDKTELFHDDLSVSRGSTEDTVHLPNGKELHFTSFWTAICHKEDGHWKVTRMQAGMDPVNNVFVSLQIAKAKLQFGAIGVVAGAAFGLIIGLMISKKQFRASSIATRRI